MTYVIQVVAVAGRHPPDMKDPAGLYVVDCDFQAHGGMGEPLLSARLQDARRFESAIDAADYWRTPSGTTRPWDGRPSRPLTAFTVEIFDPEAAPPRRVVDMLRDAAP